jgi:hypothetical protein
MKSYPPIGGRFSLIAVLLSAISTQVSAEYFQGSGNPANDLNLQGGTLIDFEAGPVGTFGGIEIGEVTFIGDDPDTVAVEETITIGTEGVVPIAVFEQGLTGTYRLYNGGTAESAQKFRFNFATPIHAFGFNLGAVNSSGGWLLNAFDSTGNLIVSAPVPVTQNETSNYIGIASGGISYATLENSGPNDFVMLDNFVFNRVPNLVASVLPSSRSVQIGSTASVFGTIINSGTAAGTGCGIAPVTTVSADFSYQATDPTTNAPIGTPNTPIDISAGSAQTFQFAFMPTAPFNPIDVELSFDCTNSEPAPTTVGLNTLLLSASTTQVADIIALAATPTGDGIVNLPGTTGANAFSVSTVNVGSQDTITASAVTGSAALPVTLSICESNPSTGACLAAPAPSVTTATNAGATPTFSIFVTGTGTVPFDPANNRIFVRFRDSGGVIRGSTSVAVQTVL